MTDVSSRSGATWSANPALSEHFVETRLRPAPGRAAPMSVRGVSIKTLILLSVVVAGGAWGWASSASPVAGDVGEGYANTTVTIPGGFWLAGFGALLAGIFVVVDPRRARLLGGVYALCEGFCLGAISAAFDAQTDGIVGAAVLSTLGVFLAALGVYALGLIRPTSRLTFGVAAGIGGLCLLYLFVFVLSIFQWTWLFGDNLGAIGVIVTLLAIVLAALSLVLDLGAIDEGVRAGAPDDLEWYLAFGLVVTLVWLYIGILKLLALLARGR
jgi:uncharacterized YccA/Bax inhibitor family protein